MSKSFFITCCLICFVLPTRAQEDIVDSELPGFAIKINVFPFVIRDMGIGVPRIHMGFEKRVSPRYSILTELGYGSSSNGTVFTRDKVWDISGNVGIRKYFGFKKVSKKYWIINLTQDYYRHEDKIWVCANDCQYRRRIHSSVSNWRTGIMGGVGIVLKTGSRLNWDFDIAVGLYHKNTSVKVTPEDFNFTNFVANNWIPQAGNIILPHFIHRVRLSLDFYKK